MGIQKTLNCKQQKVRDNKVVEIEYEIDIHGNTNSTNYLIHRDILRHQLSQKQGTVSTKTRSEVRGGGKKPWRQKGTGRARAGSNRSPLWKGGGVIFGPKPRTINLKLNKKERALALRTLFYHKHYQDQGNELIMPGELESVGSKTKEFCKLCKEFDINLDEKLLLVVSDSQKTLPLRLATQNLKNVELILASKMNTLSLLKSKKILFTISAYQQIKDKYKYGEF